MPHGIAQFCEWLPRPNGESTLDSKTLSSMPKVAFTNCWKDLIRARSRGPLWNVTTVKFCTPCRYQRAFTPLISFMDFERCVHGSMPHNCRFLKILVWDLERQPTKDDPLHCHCCNHPVSGKTIGDCDGGVLVLWHLDIRVCSLLVSNVQKHR
ncbi:hypothetical protein KC19_5G159400 [Ceratodon purpureus]|uniref:Uncharacterized protein n=1 Tax=Ceratodon purpureus TaxID=3225 RepID=A0A8T0I381_CERPU|nr:hypothetical protein KC19_5G159400 [Ceratodon purpureus]